MRNYRSLIQDSRFLEFTNVTPTDGGIAVIDDDEMTLPCISAHDIVYFGTITLVYNENGREVVDSVDDAVWARGANYITGDGETTICIPAKRAHLADDIANIHQPDAVRFGTLCEVPYLFTDKLDNTFLLSEVTSRPSKVIVGYFGRMINALLSVQAGG